MNRASPLADQAGIPAWRVDGMDPLAVYLATQQALALSRAGGGPAVIELNVYRFFHQNGPLPGSSFGYRTKAEETEWRQRDPLHRVATEMSNRQLIDAATIEKLRERARKFRCEQPTRSLNRLAARVGSATNCWPPRDFVDFGVRGDGSGIREAAHRRTGSVRGSLARTQVRGCDPPDVIGQRMETQPVVILGEDIHRLKGGTNGATRGLAARFPARVLGTPISENAFCGLAGGMAMDGRFRPIVEFMYADFMWVAADQVFNQIGKARHMFGGDIAMPWCCARKWPSAPVTGSQHSMDPAGIFATSPGWRIAAPAAAFDYVGMMNAAIACSDPCSCWSTSNFTTATIRSRSAILITSFLEPSRATSSPDSTRR